MRGFSVGDEELRGVCVWTWVGHGKDTFMRMWIPNVFIVELGTVDTHASCSVLSCDITCLRHKIMNYSMKEITFISQIFFIITGTYFQKVLSSQWYLFSEKLKYDLSFFITFYSWFTNFNLKENLIIIFIKKWQLIKFCFLFRSLFFIIQSSSKRFCHNFSLRTFNFSSFHFNFFKLNP